MPFILAGTERTLASIFAFGEFVPGLFARIWLDVQRPRYASSAVRTNAAR